MAVEIVARQLLGNARDAIRAGATLPVEVAEAVAP
jgi:hypothetical protein